MSKSGWIVGAVVVAAGVGGWALLARKSSNEPKYRKEKLDRGDVVATVTAAGTLSAVITVKVGSQVSGIISRLYVDFNSEVKKGQLLAELDPTPFQASVDQRKADVEKAKVELRNAEVAYTRARSLNGAQLLSRAELDTALANRDSAAASVEQSNAALKQAMTNLAYTRITSPIDGVVVDRQYDIGQTVAASFQAPTLFTIAQDLTKMQVLTNIDEADIGRVKIAQRASFSVDAFPDRPFGGLVSQIRLSPQTVQNVVTYPVLLDVENPEGRLKPGMTANVQIPVDRRPDALRVPNAALRFKPAPDDLLKTETKPAGKADEKAAEGKATPPAPPAPSAAPPAAGTEDRTAGGPGRRGGGSGGSEGGRGRGGAGGPGGWGGGGGRPGGGSRGTGTVHVEVPGGKLKAVKVRTLLTDGNFTAIESDELKEGDEIVVGLVTARAGDASSSRPPMGGGGGGGPRGGMR